MHPAPRIHRAPGLGRTRADGSVRILTGDLASGLRALSGRILIVTVTSFALTGCFLVSNAFPDRVVSPEMTGIIQSADRIAFEGTEYELDPFADYSDGGAGEGDLLLFGTTPDVWYVAAHPLGEDGCYTILVGTAYDDGDSVIVVFSGFDFGVRLEKGEGFNAAR